jgi:hypothetical protein
MLLRKGWSHSTRPLITYDKAVTSILATVAPYSAKAPAKN